MSAVGAPPIRVQRRRTKGWRIPKNTAAVDRSTYWGNPFLVSLFGQEKAVAMFRDHLESGPHRYWSERRNRLHELRGKNLACWCALPEVGLPDLCHAAVLLEVANVPTPTDAGETKT